MWLINVVIIITFVFYIIQLMSKTSTKKDPVLYMFVGIAIFLETVFVICLVNGKDLNNFMQVLVLIFSYIIPILLVSIKGLEKSVKLTLVHYVAKFMYLVRNYEFAEGLLAKTIIQDRKNIEFYYLRAKALEKLDRVSDAKDVLLNSLTVNPDSAEVYYKIAVLLDKQGNKEAAIAMLNQAVTLNPGYTEAKEMLGILFSDLGYATEAKAIYEDIAINNEATVDTFFNLAVIYSAAGEINKAISAYDKVLELDDEMYEAYYSIGRLYYVKEEYELAKDSLEKAMLDKNLKTKAEYTLALINMKMGDINDAVTHITNVIKQDNSYVLMAKKERLFKPIMAEIYALEDGELDVEIAEEVEENIEE